MAESQRLQRRNSPNHPAACPNELKHADVRRKQPSPAVEMALEEVQVELERPATPSLLRA